MPTTTGPPTTNIGRDEMTGDQLARPGSERVSAYTRYGPLLGGRVKNGCQVFLNVPYGLEVTRWEDPKPLPKPFRYRKDEYTTDSLYCAQPTRPYTLQVPVRDRLGLGQPTENPFFADIYVPKDVDLTKRSCPQPRRLLPVRVFLHGGFLQFGTTSGQHYNQQFFASQHFGEVRVLLGHRLSVFGFLASESPPVDGNFGFKDCWLGLEWVRDNIAAFGGDAEQVHISGLSGGAHVVHQLLHRAARLAPQRAPFVSALLQSNAVLSDPLLPSDRSEQFAAFCDELGADPASPTILSDLRDTDKYPTEALIAAVQRMGLQSTFRGVASPDRWLHPDQMDYQRRGGLGRDLLAAGVRVVVAGDVRDEDWFYQGVHECRRVEELLPNVARYYPEDLAQALLDSYPTLDANAPPEAVQARLGRVLADGQVHLPVRLLASDLAKAGLPSVRYTVETTPSLMGHDGHVTHASDLPFQHLRLSVLTPEETESALQWHAAVTEAITPALNESGQFVQPRGDDLDVRLALAAFEGGGEAVRGL